VTEPPFRRLAICGLGLIGGSIALGCRRRWPGVAVLGVDRAEVLGDALARQAITDARSSVADLEDVDLVVLAAPVPEIEALLRDAGRVRLPVLLTDVGSTKRHIMAAAEAAGVRFVGGHPVAGAAAGGFPAARADLFDGREWLIVADGAAGEDVAAVESLARGLGAAPRRVDADAHDRLMAYVSHLPQLLATALMTTAGEGVGREGLAAAGPGFADMTRLASSPAEIWRGILATNGDYVAEAVNALVRTLPAAEGELSNGARVEAIFREAHRWSAGG
jgi:prephenate dehydrogenase